MRRKVESLLSDILLLTSKIDKLSEQVSTSKNQFHDSILLDNANWGVMFAKNSINALLTDIDIREYLEDEEAARSKKEKPQGQRKTSVGNGNVFHKPNNRTRRKTKGV